MSKKTKNWLIMGTVFVLLGCIIFAFVMSRLNWDFNKLSTAKFETNKHKISEEFKKISIKTDTADIKFLISEDGKCNVECYEEEKAKHKAFVKEDTLVIELDEKKQWHDYIGFNFTSPNITVSLPKAEYETLFVKADTSNIVVPSGYVFESTDISLSTGDVSFCSSVKNLLKIKTHTGKVNIKDTSAGSIGLTTSTGDISVFDVDCKNDLSIKVSTGKTKLSNLECKKLTASADTGDISLDCCDADEIFIQTDTGDVSGKLLSEKVYITKTDTGRVSVPKTTKGGRCEIITNTGNIKFE